MKPCSPHDWSKRRAAIGVVMLSALLVVFAIATRSIWMTCCVGCFYVAADRLLLWALNRTPVAASVFMTYRNEVDVEILMAGSAIRLTATLQCRRTTDCLLLPLAPASATPIQPEAYRGRLHAGHDTTVEFVLNASRPGVVVFPGMIVRNPSPFHLFACSQLVPHRTTVTVLPNYRDESGAVLARFLGPLQRAGLLRRHVLRGFGTDFHELREYRPSDTRNRVDWKATARRDELIVREFEEPREFEIQVVLDASISMCFGSEDRAAYTNATEFVGRLAFVALAQDITFRLHRYNDGGVTSDTMPGNINGFVRLLNNLAWMPRSAVISALERSPTRLTEAMTTDAWRHAVRHWSTNQCAPDLNAFCEQYFADTVPHGSRRIEFIADFRPEQAIDTPSVCTDCSEAVFAEEPRCGRCGAALGRSGHSPRTEAACAAIGTTLRHSRNRQILMFVSALGGGEPCDALTQMLLHAHTPFRSVHVVVPNERELKDARPASPNYLGNLPTREEALRNVHQLRRAASFALFRRCLQAGGVHLHPVDDRAQLNRVIVNLLMTEVQPT